MNRRPYDIKAAIVDLNSIQAITKIDNGYYTVFLNGGGIIIVNENDFKREKLLDAWTRDIFK